MTNSLFNDYLTETSQHLRVKTSPEGIKVFVGKCEFFFCTQIPGSKATEKQWKARGYLVKQNASPKGTISIGPINREQYYFVFHISDCQPINGQKAARRRKYFHNIVGDLDNLKKGLSRIEFYDKLAL